MQVLKKNQEILLTIKRLGINGEGIGYYKKMAVFVDGAIPDEEVIVRIETLEDKHATGTVVGVKKRVATRAKPFCVHYDTCGGCQLQHIVLNEQYRLKQQLILQALERYAGLDPNAVPMQAFDVDHHDRYYRYKAQMPVRNTPTGLVTGLYRKNSQALVDVLDCPVQDKRINAINQEVLRLAAEHDIRALDTKTFKGLLRTLVTRVSKATGEIQVTLVVSIYNHALKSVAQEILKLPGVVSVAISKHHNVKDSKVFGETFEVLAGVDTITEQLGDKTYRLNPKAFFQLNPEVAKQMYDYIQTLITPEETTLVDLFCGAGAISLYLADHFQKVVGIDASKESIEAAHLNAQDNAVDHVQFMCEDAAKGLNQLKEKFDCAIFDPPRTGCGEALLQTLKTRKIPKLIYVSCNPSTFAKDISQLQSLYDIQSIKPFDMFPHTAHVESVTLLSLKTA